LIVGKAATEGLEKIEKTQHEIGIHYITDKGKINGGSWT
jgi:hypothetical protein